MKRITASLLALSLLLVVIPVEAASPEQILQSNAGVAARFVHRFLAKGFKKEQLEQGTVLFGPSPAMRWTYTTPEPKTFVFDGRTSWLYAPEEKQVTVSELSEQQRQNLPFLMFADTARVRVNYAIREKVGRQLSETTLLAKNRELIVQKIVMQTSTRDGLLRRLEYLDRSGNRTVFEFSGQTRQTMTPDSFTFVPPKGVEIIRN